MKTSDFSYDYIIKQASKNCTEIRKKIINRLKDYVDTVGVKAFNTANSTDTLPSYVKKDVDFLVSLFYLNCMLNSDEEESNDNINFDSKAFNIISKYIEENSLNEFENNLYYQANLPQPVKDAVDEYLISKPSKLLTALYEDMDTRCKHCTVCDCNNPCCRKLKKLFDYVRKDKANFEKEFYSDSLPDDIQDCLYFYEVFINPDLTLDLDF